MNKTPRKKRFLSLRNRYASSIVLFIVLAVAFSYLQLRYMDSMFTYSAKQSMISAAGQVLETDFSSASYHKRMSELESAATIYVEVYRDREELIYTSNTNSWVYDADSSAAEIMKPRIMEINSHEDVDESSYFEERQEHFSSAKYIVYECTKGELTAVLYYSVDTIRDNAATAKIALLVVAAVFLAVTITITSFYNKQIIAPVEKINAVTKQIAAMDFSGKLPPFNIRDLKELGENVNILSDSLAKNMQQLKESNEKLKEDFEREKRAEDSRKEFVANASHEFKTPIAIIQSYAEGIKYDETGANIGEYCDIILDETEKMNNLIIRLLKIAKLESDAFKPELKDFSIDEWVERFSSTFSLPAQKKGIKMAVDASTNAVGRGNVDMLEEVLSNFLSNAISHCGGEKRISVTAEIEDGKARISVFNTGDHIKDDDLPNLWKNFYRSDKAHSRAEGRFGLGLSIVKTIQEIHGEDFGVENVEGGVRFWFDIKIVSVC